MAPTLRPERRPVEYVPLPGSHLWVAVCLGLGGAFFSASLALGLGEALASMERAALEALFIERS